MRLTYLGDSYEMVKEVERLEGLHERAKIIVESEKLHPHGHTYPHYLHLLEPSSDDGDVASRPWEGIAGKVKQEIGELKKSTHAHIEQVQAELTAKLQGQAKKLDDLLHAVMTAAKTAA